MHKRNLFWKFNVIYVFFSQQLIDGRIVKILSSHVMLAADAVSFTFSILMSHCDSGTNNHFGD